MTATELLHIGFYAALFCALALVLLVGWLVVALGTVKPYHAAHAEPDLERATRRMLIMRGGQSWVSVPGERSGAA